MGAPSAGRVLVHERLNRRQDGVVRFGSNNVEVKVTVANMTVPCSTVVRCVMPPKTDEGCHRQQPRDATENRRGMSPKTDEVCHRKETRGVTENRRRVVGFIGRTRMNERELTPFFIATAIKHTSTTIPQCTNTRTNLHTQVLRTQYTHRIFSQRSTGASINVYMYLPVSLRVVLHGLQAVPVHTLASPSTRTFISSTLR